MGAILRVSRDYMGVYETDIGQLEGTDFKAEALGFRV